VKARSLGELGAAVSNLTAAHEASSQAAMQRAAALFKEVVQSDTPDQVLKRKRQEIDEAFFVVLGANIERARRQGQDAPVRALELIGRLAQAAQQERHV
jgi:translation elongation factor EF-Ts